MRLIYLILIFFISNTSFSQDNIDFKLTGTWKVERFTTNFSDITSEQQQYIDKLKTAFEEAKFQFKKDGHFIIDIDFDDISQQMQNAFWKFSPSELKVTILDWSDNDTNEPSWEWPIRISKSNGKTFFILMSSKFNLQVSRI